MYNGGMETIAARETTDTCQPMYSIVGLRPDQNLFLAHRLRVSSDLEACRLAGFPQDRLDGWKARDAQFLDAYQRLNTDAVALAQRLTREDLGRAALVLRQGMEATRPIILPGGVVELVPDYRERREAAQTILTIHGAIKTRVDITLRLREAAEREGLDPDDVMAEALALMGGTGAPKRLVARIVNGDVDLGAGEVPAGE